MTRDEAMTRVRSGATPCEPCPYCDGRGWYELLHPPPWEEPVEQCTACGGSGSAPRRIGHGG